MAITMIPSYSTELFQDIYPDVASFMADYNGQKFPKIVKDSNVRIIYYSLMARYGNNPIANLDVEQFKTKLQAVLWQYGPSWEKRLEIQEKLRNLSDIDILEGAQAIYNHASNPGELEAETTVDLPELKYIDNQNTTNYKKSKMDAYTQLWDLLVSDVTNEFLNKFRPLFKQFVRPERQYIYESEE